MEAKRCAPRRPSQPVTWVNSATLMDANSRCKQWHIGLAGYSRREPRPRDAAPLAPLSHGTGGVDWVQLGNGLFVGMPLGFFFLSACRVPVSAPSRVKPNPPFFTPEKTLGRKCAIYISVPPRARPTKNTPPRYERHGAPGRHHVATQEPPLRGPVRRRCVAGGLPLARRRLLT